MHKLDVRYTRGQDTRRMFGGGIAFARGAIHIANDVFLNG
jgi:hypothetical protein